MSFLEQSYVSFITVPRALEYPHGECIDTIGRNSPGIWSNSNEIDHASPIPIDAKLGALVFRAQERETTAHDGRMVDGLAMETTDDRLNLGAQ